jgi:hypothetical protein
MHLTTQSPIEDGLLLVGIPFQEGRYSAQEKFALVTDDGEALPIWWTPRATWPDGSLKWIWLHARVPVGESSLEFRDSQSEQTLPEPHFEIDGQQVAFRDAELRFAAKPGSFSLQLGEQTLEVLDEPDLFEPDLASDTSSMRMEVTEASPIAPLIRMCHPVAEGLRKEYLLRIDPVHGSVEWTRRITVMSEPQAELLGMSAKLQLPGRSWCLSGLEDHCELLVPVPHRMSVSGDERAGNPEALLVADGAAAFLDKGWQRAPFALKTIGASAEIQFYPRDVSPLKILQGTSFRHVVRLALGENAHEVVRSQVRWSWGSEDVTGTGAFGPLAPRNAEVQQLFPGFDKAFEHSIEHCRPTKLDKPDGTPPGPPGDLGDETTHDAEFFGLQHYGDWPMGLGAYGGSARMYCDNEYDVPYALFQQFARTGRWEILELARHSAVHMTDVDFLAHNGDMRFHGYHQQAEDHQAARSLSGEFGHYWGDGYWCLHFIHGDPFAREAASALSAKLCRDFQGEDDDAIRSHFIGCERAVGWPMVTLCAAAEVKGDPEILETMERMSVYVAKYMEDPDAEFEGIDTISGSPVQWWRCAALDGCKPFMLGVLMEGLERYHRLSGSPAAREALLAVARFLRDVMWVPTVGAFIYELNAYNRGHRTLYPHYINLLVTRGLAYAYELSGDESFRKLTLDAAYGGLWTVFETTGGKEIGMVGRTSGATVAYMLGWWKKDRDALARSQPSSEGESFEFMGSPAEILDASGIVLRKGEPRFEADGNLICDQESFAICDIDPSWNTDAGQVVLEYAPFSAINWDHGGNPNPGWGIFHLSDDKFTASAITVMHFYSGLHVRFYDRDRKLIDVLEVDVQGWQAGLRRRIEFKWNSEDAILFLDGDECHRVPMQRRISGAFRRLYLGCKPGNWKGKGTLSRLEIRLESSS